MAYGGEAFRLVRLDPGEQRGGRRGMWCLAGQLQGGRAYLRTVPAVSNFGGAGVERQHGTAKRRAGLVGEIDTVAMGGGGNCEDIGGRPAGGFDCLPDGRGGCLPHAVHVTFDMTGRGHFLLDALACDGKRGSVDIEDDSLGHCQTTVDPDDTGHVYSFKMRRFWRQTLSATTTLIPSERIWVR